MFLNIVVHIISNLRFQNDDVGIVIACCSTLRVIIRHKGPESFAMHIDELVVLVTDLFYRYCKSTEIAAACLLILEEIAIEDRHMLDFCSNSDLMLQVYEVLKSLKNEIKKEVKYNLSIVSAFHLLNKALRDENVLAFILDDDLKIRRNFIRKLKYRLKEHVGIIPEYCSCMNLSRELEGKLNLLVTDLFSMIESLIVAEGIDFIDEDYDDSAEEENGVVGDIEDMGVNDMDIDKFKDDIKIDNGVGEKVENGKKEVEYGEIEVVSGMNEVVRGVEKKQEVDKITAKDVDFDASEVTDLDDICTVDSNIFTDGRNTIASAVCNTPYDSTSASTSASTPDSTSLVVDQSLADFAEVTQQYQQHAVTAIERADMMHQLFIDATSKIENLIRESDALRYQVLNLTEQKGAENIESEGVHSDDHDSNDKVLKIENLERLLELDGFSDTDNDSFGHNNENDGIYSGVNGGVNRRKTKHEFTVADYDVVPYNENFRDDRMSCVIDGVIEALRIVYSKETKYESMDIKNIRRSILQHGWSEKGMWSKSRPIEGIFHVGSSKIMFNKIYELGDVINRIFNHLKECEITGAVGLFKKSVLKTSLVRNALKDMNFKMRDVDILCSSLGVPHLSLIGLSYVLATCAVKRFHKNNFEIVVDKLINISKLYWLQAKIMIRLREEKVAPIVEPIRLTRQGMAKLMLTLDREKNVMSSIYKAYIETPKYFPSGSSPAKGSSFKPTPTTLSVPGGLSGFGCSEGYSQGGTLNLASSQIPGIGGDHNHGNSSSSGSRNSKIFPIQKIENDIDKQKGPGIGISYKGIVQFSQDFDLYPSVLSTSQLFTIFNEVVSINEEYSDTEEEVNPSKKESIKPQQYLNIGNNNDALLTLDQFQGLLIAVAFTSQFFQNEIDTSSSMQLRGGNNEELLYLQAVKKVNRLLIYLNESRGQERLSKKYRSVTSSVLIFKPIS